MTLCFFVWLKRKDLIQTQRLDYTHRQLNRGEHKNTKHGVKDTNTAINNKYITTQIKKQQTNHRKQQNKTQI